jgi:rhodanese-related sulfurtransferase
MNELFSSDVAKLLEKEDSFLIDVRSAAEWQFVGCPDLKEFKATYLQISLYEYPEMSFNNNFITKIQEQGNITKNSNIIFICRSGIRSRKAAQLISDLGYKNIYNISDGFEGELDEYSHRNTLSGWKKSGLPWKQS